MSKWNLVRFIDIFPNLVFFNNFLYIIYIMCMHGCPGMAAEFTEIMWHPTNSAAMHTRTVHPLHHDFCDTIYDLISNYNG